MQRRQLKIEKKLSKSYGVNRRCPLTQVTGFHPTTSTPPEIGHDILSGVAPLHTKRLLYRFCIVGKWMSLEEFNKRLDGFDYGYSENLHSRPHET